jgi:hypothetical protein
MKACVVSGDNERAVAAADRYLAECGTARLWESEAQRIRNGPRNVSGTVGA